MFVSSTEKMSLQSRHCAVLNSYVSKTAVTAITPLAGCFCQGNVVVPTVGWWRRSTCLEWTGHGGHHALRMPGLPAAKRPRVYHHPRINYIDTWSPTTPICGLFYLFYSSNMEHSFMSPPRWKHLRCDSFTYVAGAAHLTQVSN